MLFHLIARSDWEQRPSGPFRADSLASEGFIHCSYAHQVARVANLFYRDVPDLLVLHVDPARLSSAVKDEDPGIGEAFPHVYGPIDEPAIVRVESVQGDATGQWLFPA